MKGRSHLLAKSLEAYGHIGLIRKAVGSTAPIQFDQTRPTGVFCRTPDISRARSILNWEPQVSLEQGIQATVDWIRSVAENIFKCIQPFRSLIDSPEVSIIQASCSSSSCSTDYSRQIPNECLAKSLSMKKTIKNYSPLASSDKKWQNI